MRLEGAVVAITGASRGLGKCLAIRLAARRARVVVSGRDVDELTTVAESIGALAVPCDVTRFPEVERLVATCDEELGGLDIFINNAGIWAPEGPVVGADLSWMRRLTEVNFFGTVYGSQAALRSMSVRGSGAIVNILSTAALGARPDHAIYSATKFAAAGFTKGLIEEAQPLGVRVFGIYPGGMQTDIFRTAGDPQDPEEFARMMDPMAVAERILVHLEADDPASEIVIRQ